MNPGFHDYAAYAAAVLAGELVEYDENRFRGINNFCTLIKQNRGGNET